MAAIGYQTYEEFYWFEDFLYICIGDIPMMELKRMAEKFVGKGPQEISKDLA